MPSVGSRAKLVLVALVVVVASLVLAGPAQQRAIAAEEDYLADKLDDASCLSDWGANEGIGTAEAPLAVPTPGGFFVSVDMPYTYTRSRGLHVDGESDAIWFVSPLGSHRVSGQEEIIDC